MDYCLSGTTLSSRDTLSTSALGVVQRQVHVQTLADPKVVESYQKDGSAFLLRVFNELGYLESITGLDKLYAEAEAALNDVDWAEGSDDSGEL